MRSSLLDQENWPQTGSATGDGQVDGEQPERGIPDPDRPLMPQVDRDGAIDLRELVRRRNELVDDADFFDLLNQWLKAQQAFAQANRNLQAANGNRHAKSQAVAMAAAQRNPGMVADAQRQLGAAEVAVRRALADFQSMQRNLLALNGRVFPVVVDLLVTYRAMRDFVVHDRSDPSLAEVRDVLLEAVRGRQDFYEGHVLLALCEAYLGDRVQAREHLDRASFLTGRPFFDWPMSDDMYLAHVLLGESDKVVTWAKWVDEVNEERKTSTRCWIVALHNATSCKDHSAAEWFDRCERKLKRSAKKAKEPLKVPAPVAGEWALFLLTCPNEKLRYVQQAQMLLEKVPPLESAWQVLRARAALAAQQGDWPRAVAEIQGCLERAPVSLRTELEAQVAAYESQQVWTRQRP